MNQDELDKNYNSVMLLDRDIDSIKNQIQKIKDNIWEIADNISSASKPVAKYSAKQFKDAKNKDDFKIAAMTGAAAVVIDGVGKTFGLMGSVFAEIKGEFKLQKLRSKKKEVALAKIKFAEMTLAWGTVNEDKLGRILKNELSLVVNSYELDSELYYETRQKSLDNYLKCLTIIKMSEFLIKTYKIWINRSDNQVEKPSKQWLLKNYFIENSQIFPSKMTKEYFIKELQMPTLRADIILLLQNEMFFNLLPITADELIKVAKYLPDGNIAKIAITNNSKYQNAIKLKRKKRKKTVYGWIFLIASVSILLFFNSWGWWNLLMVPFSLILFITAIFLYLDQ